MPTVSASPYLPTGQQKIPQHAPTELAVIWSGGPGTVLLDGSPIGVSASVFKVMGLPKPNAFDLAVKGEDGQVLHWSVKVVPQTPPAPKGYGALGPPSSEERLERPLWLPEPGREGEVWRLFAISEIAALRTTSLAADLAWRQVATGQYQVPGE